VQRRTKGDWEIDFNELEVGEQIGSGGYGEVSKAMWKGTEVAVKMMAATSITKDMERDFRDEVRIVCSPFNAAEAYTHARFSVYRYE
jgi:serine/threonine protein kinase